MPISQIVTNSIADDVTIKFADGSASAPSITNNGDTNTGIFFPAADTIAFSEGGTEAMRIDGSGNLGIGTSSPQNDSGYKTLTLNGSSGGQLSFRVNDANTGSIYSSAGALNLATALATNMTFITATSERMRIDSSGNLMVGCTVPPVTGGAGSYGIGFQPNVSVAGTTTMIFRSNTTAASDAAYFYTSVGLVGFIRTSGTSTTYSTTSDYRLKENVQPMVGALEKVQQLKPCTYTWKQDNSNGQGFIAHELQEVVPECVAGEKDAVNEDGSIKPQGIDTSFLVATLTAAIQELKAELDSVKAELVKLKA